MTPVKFSPEAVKDLQEIQSYIANELCSQQAADRTVSKILGRIRRLSSFPEIGTPLSAIFSFDTNYRYLVCGHYTAFYRVEQDAVYIVRILYGRRDFMRILFGEPPEENE